MDKKYFYIAIAIILTSMISLSMHVFIIQYFQPPKLTINPNFNPIIGYIIRLCTVIAAILIYIFSQEHWARIRLFFRVILFAILIMALTESLLRATSMNIIVGNFWLTQILQAIPSYLTLFGLALFICLLVPNILVIRKFQILWYTLFAILTTMTLILLGEVTKRFIAPVLARMPQVQSTISQLPYGMNILIPSYITFLEPTIAAFIVYYLIADRLSALNTPTKGFILGGIIITIHAGIYSILQIICSEGNILYRIFYYGQFLWEYLALGLLTAYSFALIKR